MPGGMLDDVFVASAIVFVAVSVVVSVVAAAVVGRVVMVVADGTADVGKTDLRLTSGLLGSLKAIHIVIAASVVIGCVVVVCCLLLSLLVAGC